MEILQMEEITKTQEQKPKKEKEYMRVRGYPETLFFYPSMIVSVIIFLIYLLEDNLSDMGFVLDDPMKSALGTFFFAVFAFNFLIVAFDFGLGKTALLATSVIIIVLIYLLLRTQITDLDFGFVWPDIHASMEFYFFFAALVFVHLVIIYFYSRIDYWIISPTEIYHHRGILGDERRFGNAQHAHIEKTTPDIFEKMLFLSGDIFIKPETDPHIYRIANVFRVNKKEEEIRKILSYVPDKRVEF